MRDLGSHGPGLPLVSHIPPVLRGLAVVPHPLLLSRTSRLSDETAHHLAAAGIERVLLVGGEAARSDRVILDLEALDIEATRIAGDDRVQTASAVVPFTAADGTPQRMIVIVQEGVLCWMATSPDGLVDAVTFEMGATSIDLPVTGVNEGNLVRGCTAADGVPDAIDPQSDTATVTVDGVGEAVRLLRL